MYNDQMNKKFVLEQICKQFNINIIYVFGSRAHEILTWLRANDTLNPEIHSDIDVGITTTKRLSIKQKVALTIALEDFFNVHRVDLVIIPQADPFLAANIIRGERLYAVDNYLADEYDLYILRRAGDLIPLERERQQLIMESGA